MNGATTYIYVPRVTSTAASTGTTTATTENDSSTAVVGGITDGIRDTVAVTRTKVRVYSIFSCHTLMKKKNM